MTNHYLLLDIDVKKDSLEMSQTYKQRPGHCLPEPILSKDVRISRYNTREARKGKGSKLVDIRHVSTVW
jgi:hypothetical protein